MRKQYLEAGKIVGTHGVKGELKVQAWCDSPEFFCGFSTLYWNRGEQKAEVVSSRVHKNLILLKLKGVDTVEDADKLRDKLLFLNRSDAKLEDGAHFIQDLIGLQAVDADTGKGLGTLTDVLKTGANDVYEITGSDGKKYLVPVIPEVVLSIDLDAETLLLRPLKGIFDDED